MSEAATILTFQLEYKEKDAVRSAYFIANNDREAIVFTENFLKDWAETCPDNQYEFVALYVGELVGPEFKVFRKVDMKYED